VPIVVEEQVSQPGVLAYHRAVADWLEQSEPRGWASVLTGLRTTPEPDDESLLLRHAYRLEAEGHPAVHAALARATENLGVREPVAVYQLEGGAEMNAGLVELPGELAVLLSGNLLSLLDETGLGAVFGHELAHHVLLTLEGGRYRVAARLLDLLSVDAATPPPYLETARRFALATELFCDRGSVRACGDLPAAVKALVSVATGLAEVDPVAYLAQARKADPGSGSRGRSHPETVLRAWALEQWATGIAGELGPGEEAARSLLRPSLDLDQLDVLDRADLEHVTRSVISGFLLGPERASAAVLAHVHQFFPGLTVAPDGEAWGSPSLTALPGDLSSATRQYLAYVLLDLVAVDPELDLERSVAEGVRYAERIGLGAAFIEVAKAELALSAAAWNRVGALEAAG
jgi:Zn-dependent protease with chaperone function